MVAPVLGFFYPFSQLNTTLLLIELKSCLVVFSLLLRMQYNFSWTFYVWRLPNTFGNCIYMVTCILTSNSAALCDFIFNYTKYFSFWRWYYWATIFRYWQVHMSLTHIYSMRFLMKQTEWCLPFCFPQHFYVETFFFRSHSALECFWVGSLCEHMQKVKMLKIL